MEKLQKSIKSYIANADWYLIVLTLACSCYGLLLVFSATLTFQSYKLVAVQAGAMVLGVIMMVIISKIDYVMLGELWKFIIVLCVLFMALTLAIGTGPSGTTNRSWIDLKFLSIQPAEFVKIGFIVTFAAHLSRAQEHLSSIKNVALLMLHAGTMIGLVLLTGDTGVAGVFMFIALVMLFVAGLKIWYFIGGFVACVAGAPFLWGLLNKFQRDRIMIMFNPELDPLDKGYQVVQSKIAIGSGMMNGKGLFHGTITQSKLLPAKQTDFIFAVAGEELGFLGAALILLLLTLLILRVVVVSKKSRNDLGTLICAGVYAMLIIQFLGNVGMCVGLFPVIGITLPFFSYGGSSMLTNFCAIGLVLAVYMQRKTQQY